MNNTGLDFTLITGAVLGYFISISIVTAPFYKNRAHNYLSFSLFPLTSISLLGWYDADEGIFELLHAITWGFLIPVTLFTYFLIQVEHLFLKRKWYKWLYFPFFSTLIIEVFLNLDFNFSLHNSSFDEEGLAVQVF